MSPESRRRKTAQGLLHLKFAMHLARKQIQAGRKFLFEHPATASSWTEDAVLLVAQMPAVDISSFDQCRFGLLSPPSPDVPPTPLKKRTSFLSNSAACAPLRWSRTPP
eukprot:5243100-Alexandrium_andersonii.AAC.1